MTPISLRVEGGETFELTTTNAQTPVWEYVRLETGEDLLMGPKGLTSLKPLASLRLGAGDVGPLQSGTAP